MHMATPATSSTLLTTPKTLCDIVFASTSVRVKGGSSSLLLQISSRSKVLCQEAPLPQLRLRHLHSTSYTHRFHRVLCQRFNLDSNRTILAFLLFCVSAPRQMFQFFILQIYGIRQRQSDNIGRRSSRKK